MKFFFDTEFFVEDGMPVSIQGISIGIAAEDGRTYYAEYEGAREAASQTQWLRDNVLPQLTGPELPVSTIAREIRGFVGESSPEFLAAYGAYDWVVLCQTFGGLGSLPKGWPEFYTEVVPLNHPRVARVGNTHKAVADAATLLRAWQASQPATRRAAGDECSRCGGRGILSSNPYWSGGKLCSGCSSELIMERA